MRETLFPRVSEFDGQWVLREMLDRREPPVMANEASCLQKESYANMETLSLKNEGAASNLGSRTISWFWQFIQQIWLFYKIQQVVLRKFCLDGIASPCLPKTLPSILIWLRSVLITDSENQRSDWGLFLLAWLRRHRLPLWLPPAWALVRSARNRRFTCVNEAELPSKSQLKKVLEVLAQHPYLKLFLHFTMDHRSVLRN